MHQIMIISGHHTKLGVKSLNSPRSRREMGVLPEGLYQFHSGPPVFSFLHSLTAKFHKTHIVRNPSVHIPRQTASFSIVLRLMHPKLRKTRFLTFFEAPENADLAEYCLLSLQRSNLGIFLHPHAISVPRLSSRSPELPNPDFAISRSNQTSKNKKRDLRAYATN